MTLRDLNIGDTFRFAFGFSIYIITYTRDTDEMGWLIDFVNTRTGQRYQYTEPLFGNKKDITKRKVTRIKSNVIAAPKSKYEYLPLNDNDVEKYYGIKLSKNAICKY